MTESDVNVILVRLAGMDAKLDSLADHETRIRALERMLWKIAGFAAALGALGGFGGGLAVAFSRIAG